MTVQGYLGDPQWARALAAVALALVAFHGVARAGGPLALARDAEPVSRMATQAYCATARMLHAGDAGHPHLLQPGKRG